MEEYIINEETLERLERLSAKLEQLKDFAELVNWHVWQNVKEADKESLSDAIERAVTLTEALSEIALVRDEELSEIIRDITHRKAPLA